MVQTAAWVAGGLSIAAYIPYIWCILRGRCRPDLTSWLIWSAEYLVLFTALYRGGVHTGLWLPGAELAGTLITTLLALFRHEPGVDWERVLIMLGFVGGALLAWSLVGIPFAAVIIILAIDGTGIVMTTMNAYRDPDNEPPAAWTLWALGGCAGVAAIPSGADPLNYAFPIFLALTCWIVLWGIWAGSVRLGRLEKQGFIADLEEAAEPAPEVLELPADEELERLPALTPEDVTRALEATPARDTLPDFFERIASTPEDPLAWCDETQVELEREREFASRVQLSGTL